MHWLPLGVYMAFIMAVSVTPTLPLPDVRGIDKVMHFGAYFVLGLLMTGALWRDDARLRAFVVSSLACFAYGALIEMIQAYVPGRSCELFDAIANGAGGLVGSFTYYKARGSFGVRPDRL